MTEFTPWSALAGGALIGLAALLLMAFNGRIAGIASIVGSVFSEPAKQQPWRAAFLLGLILAPFLALFLGLEVPNATPSAGLVGLIAGGLLVGYGTRLGSGCTSGHGVCGLARLSPRSLVATVTFMAAAAATVFVMRHVVGG